MSKISILFDFDGTICDSFAEGMRVLNHLSEEFNFKRVNLDNLEPLRALGAKEFLSQLGIPIYRLPFLVKRVRIEMLKKINDLHPFPCIKK